MFEQITNRACLQIMPSIQAAAKHLRGVGFEVAEPTITVDLDADKIGVKDQGKPLTEIDVVFDKFHIVKLVNERLDEVRRALLRQAEDVCKSSIKGIRFLLLTRRTNLEEDKQQSLEAAALKLNQPLFAAYYLKEELLLLWEQPTPEAMLNFLQGWCQRALNTGLAAFQRLAKTLLGHRTGILSWFTHRINSGRMEGINNKIRTMTRSA